jgi:glycine cleavage system transcriptional repressor
MHTYIVTVTAADRVGIVFSVAGTLRDQGGNILELSQTVMRGNFTIILAVQFPEPRPTRQLADAIAERGRRFDLTVAVIEAKTEGVAPPVPNGERFILTVLGDDGPGNIHGIAGCLAAHGVNIVDLHARVDGTRFSLIMEAFLPPDLAPGTVRAELERFGRDHGLEAYVQHENIFLATSEPRPVRVGPAWKAQGDAVAPH